MEVHICKNCKHCKENWIDWDSLEYVCKKERIVDIYDGFVSYVRCYNIRKGTQCDNYEPKPTLYERIKKLIKKIRQ